MNPRDCWSTHAEAHVLEMEGRQDDGISFLSKTLNDWTVNKLSALPIMLAKIQMRSRALQGVLYTLIGLSPNVFFVPDKQSLILLFIPSCTFRGT